MSRSDRSAPHLWGEHWRAAAWLNPPPSYRCEADQLTVTTAANTDLWRHTSYGFVHDSGHALLAPLPDSYALEVTFTADLTHQFDQAGLLIRADHSHWIKAGLELSDGTVQLGAVVTDGRSDWSVAPVPEWDGHVITIRASRTGDAITVRACTDHHPWRLVRLLPIQPESHWVAGPYCCSPIGPGLTATFTSARLTEPDQSLHD
ncbi:MAG: DUF1349 domain-containing protein [Actinomycetota bacterium]